MRHIIYAPVFEGPDRVTVTVGMKAMILQSALVPGVDADMYAEPSCGTHL